MLQRDLLDDAMRRALALAGRGPADDPNPQVGCVILDPEGRIVAEGWHRGAGSRHAEVDALGRVPEAWRSRPGELTAVVTLEPCNHVGRTGPCALALAEFGIGSVAFALDDPGDASAGGAESLRAAGADVLGGVLESEARALLGPWLARQRAGAAAASSATAPPAASPAAAPRPRVIAKWAQTLDGRAAAANGTSRWITGAEARADVHRRRAEADAILVGTGTLLADDPALTARAHDGELLVDPERQPVPVVVGRRPIPSGARVLRHPALAARGLEAPIRLRGDDLAADLAELARHGIRSVFVEGGPGIIGSLLARGLADEVLVYLAPALLGGPGLAIGDIGIDDISGIRRLDITETLPLGRDLLLRGRLPASSSDPPRYAERKRPADRMRPAERPRDPDHGHPADRPHPDPALIPATEEH
ncbi:dihydrofolate reductase family protein [Leucobacter sp. CSA1]|uniref:Riboflavin biosynthesis protein RibD n=1 Tax=Leucobacter chromiisoli TaxID=2796471 RepID=A0A934UUX1_9MICO|nr:dihydrofolate reductase family protein [Leucobacter chromiisoli]MBK0418623.1 dihydrofolate reductase family protein [Leucobacter chromiisoli]